jgi:hypothetical protein
MSKFRLHYHLSNNGDGSASAHFHETAKEAEKADEQLDEGWGECCASYVELKVEDGKVFFKENHWDGKKWSEVWHPAELITDKPKKGKK